MGIISYMQSVGRRLVNSGHVIFDLENSSETVDSYHFYNILSYKYHMVN